MSKTYGIKSLIISSLISIGFLFAGYFILRNKYGLVALAILLIIIDLSIYAYRYQIVTIKNGMILFSSVNPFKSRIAIEVNKINSITVVSANPLSYLFIVLTGNKEQHVRINMRSFEVKKLFQSMVASGLQIKTKGTTARNLNTLATID